MIKEIATFIWKISELIFFLIPNWVLCKLGFKSCEGMYAGDSGKAIMVFAKTGKLISKEDFWWTSKREETNASIGSTFTSDF
jgi:hypothetical protein